MNFTKVEEGIVPIYENESKERLINARELFYQLRGDNTKTKFSDWISQRISQYEFIENEDFLKIRNFTKVGNLKRPQVDYYTTINMAKELCMVENNEIGRKIRKLVLLPENLATRYLISTTMRTNILPL